MTHLLVAPVPPMTVNAVQAANRLRQIPLSRLQRRMVVVRHEAVIPALDRELLDHIAQEMDELSIVRVIEKDAHLCVAS
jgi:hypothetical protein